MKFGARLCFYTCLLFCSQMERGEYLGRYTHWAGTPPGQVHPPGRYTPGQVHPPAGTPPTPGQVHPPRQVHPPGRYSPSQVHPSPAGTPPAMHAGIRSTSGQYASYWNDILVNISNLSMALCGEMQK